MPLPGTNGPPPLPTDIDETVARALAEDLNGGDLTAGPIPREQGAHGMVISREHAVVCGQPWFDAVFRQLDAGVSITWMVKDGQWISRDQTLCRLEGPARSLLTGERTALNFLQTLSGTATVARAYADAVAGTGARVLDTRKTLPGLRSAQKYAARCGGATNHRAGLYDGILIKENHLLVYGSIAEAVKRTRAASPHAPVEVETEDLEELQQALDAGSDLILLDNFSLDELREAVQRSQGKAALEASGNVTLDTIRAIAETGVDYISCGALTKDVRAVDLSMRFIPA